MVTITPNMFNNATTAMSTAAGTFASTMNNFSYTITMTGSSLSNLSTGISRLTNWIPIKNRGWNGKNQVRCMGCARFVKVEKVVQSSKQNLLPQYAVDCKRCGKEWGFVGKRFYP